MEVLEKDKDESKNQELYEETIELYSKNSNFSFLISLFTKIYQNKKFCDSLLQKFYEINVNLKKKKKKIIAIQTKKKN